MKTINKFKKVTGAVLLITLLVSCKVSKDIKTPEMGLPESYREVTTSDTNTITEIPWKIFFSDPKLNSLIHEALTNNFDMQIAVNNIESSRQTLKQAKWANIPNLGLAATAISNRPSDNSLNGSQLNNSLGANHIEDYTIAASFSWEADIWGKIRSQKATALVGYLFTKEVQKAVQTQLISDLAKGYYNLQLLDEQLDIAEKNFRLNDSTLTIIDLQYQSGQVSSLAVQQAEAQKLTASSLTSYFQQQIVIQENTLSILSGKLPGFIERTKKMVGFDNSLSAGLPVALLKNRPEVIQAEYNLAKANALVGYTKSSMYPSLTISAQGGLDAIKASNWFITPASLFGVVASGLTQPLFQQRKLRTQYEIAKVEREKAVVRFRQTVTNAVGEVSDALVKRNKINERANILEQKVITLQKVTKNSKMLFENGLANYLEVILAQSNVLQSELELAAIKKSGLDATIDLYRAVGGGWR